MYKMRAIEKGYAGFPQSVLARPPSAAVLLAFCHKCLSVEEEVVHYQPEERRLWACTKVQTEISVFRTSVWGRPSKAPRRERISFNHIPGPENVKIYSQQCKSMKTSPTTLYSLFSSPNLGKSTGEQKPWLSSQNKKTK